MRRRRPNLAADESFSIYFESGSATVTPEAAALVRSVTAALARVGLSDVRFDTAAAGEAGSETRSGHARPLRRRADLTLHLAPRP